MPKKSKLETMKNDLTKIRDARIDKIERWYEETLIALDEMYGSPVFAVPVVMNIHPTKKKKRKRRRGTKDTRKYLSKTSYDIITEYMTMINEGELFSVLDIREWILKNFKGYNVTNDCHLANIPNVLRKLRKRGALDFQTVGGHEGRGLNAEHILTKAPEVK